MANECTFCGDRHIETNMLVLNGGEMWVEFCNHCGDRSVLRNAENGEILLVRELFARCAATANGLPFVRNPQDIALAASIAAREDAQAEDMRLSDEAEAAYWAEFERRTAEERIERAQLAIDHWDNLAYRCLHSHRYTCPNYALTMAS